MGPQASPQAVVAWLCQAFAAPGQRVYTEQVARARGRVVALPKVERRELVLDVLDFVVLVAALRAVQPLCLGVVLARIVVPEGDVFSDSERVRARERGPPPYRESCARSA